MVRRYAASRGFSDGGLADTNHPPRPHLSFPSAGPSCAVTRGTLTVLLAAVVLPVLVAVLPVVMGVMSFCFVDTLIMECFWLSVELVELVGVAVAGAGLRPRASGEVTVTASLASELLVGMAVGAVALARLLFACGWMVLIAAVSEGQRDLGAAGAGAALTGTAAGAGAVLTAGAVLAVAGA